jgi:hypothetical protein
VYAARKTLWKSEEGACNLSHRKQKEQDHEVEASLGYTVRPVEEGRKEEGRKEGGKKERE